MTIKKDWFFTTLYAASMPLAFVSVYLSMAIFLIIPAAYFFPEFVPWPHSWQTHEPVGAAILAVAILRINLTLGSGRSLHPRSFIRRKPRLVPSGQGERGRARYARLL